MFQAMLKIFFIQCFANKVIGTYCHSHCQKKHITYNKKKMYLACYSFIICPYMTKKKKYLRVCIIFII